MASTRWILVLLAVCGLTLTVACDDESTTSNGDVLDASGDVLWIPGISASVVDCPRDEANPVYLMIRGETEPA